MSLSISFTEIIPITSSLESFNLIPLTPDAFLPIGLVLLSSNLIHFPDFTAIKTWEFPVVNFASKSSSFSLIVMAFIPFDLGLEYCSRDVFLTWPSLVHIITKWLLMYSSSFKSCVQIKALTLSSGSIFIRFCIALPLEILLPSGISKTRIQKHLPFWVKNNMYWWLVPTNKYSRKSSLLVVEPFWPTPPLFCVLYSASGVLLM